MEKITAEMTIIEILKLRADAGDILRKHGMHCLGCSIAVTENLREAANVHGIDIDRLITDLNKDS
jgi:hybrid cluster-associated redox disulfide protein